jgi:two-component sensor histidine kinase
MHQITCSFIRQSLCMKLVCIAILLILHGSLSALTISPDSLIASLKTNGVDSFRILHEKEILSVTTQRGSVDEHQFLQVAILMSACEASGDSTSFSKLNLWLLSQKLTTAQRQDVLRFLFNKGGDFIAQRDVYLSFQRLGIRLAEAWGEPRVQFSFLENCMGLELFTKSKENKIKLINEMKSLSKGYPYLELRTTFHQGELYRTLQHDSCVYYFESYIEGIKPYLGKENPYFLQKTAWIQKADSGMLASAYRGYAVFAITKGEIKKAGELLVLADQTIPDTSVYDVRKIENQISLSALYGDLVNKEKTLEYALKAIARCDKHQYTKLRNGRVASAYARALMVNGNYTAAAIEYEKAYEYFKAGTSTIDPKRQALYIAILNVYTRDFTNARKWLQTAEAIHTEPFEEIEYLLATTRGLTGMSGSQSAAALSYLKEAHQLAEKNKNVRWLRESLYHLYLFYKSTSQSAQGLAAHELYVTFNDSLYRSGQQLALFDIEASYQRSLQDETIARLDTENEAAVANLTAQKRNLMIVIAGLLVTFFLLALVWRLYKQVKASNEIISKAVEEKNILLREIHHRVKNNLQVISSLLKLQSGYIKDDAAIQAIAEGRSRVQSMALLHQNLYKEDNLTGVNMKEYFDSLIQGLFDTYNISSDRIVLHKNIAEINLDVDTVVPLGLITNELISNALKHAFPGTHAGNLFVDLFEESGNLILKVRDDGTGMTKAASQEGFGSKLIQSLSQKLEADITTRTMNGTEVMLTIREYKKAA